MTKTNPETSAPCCACKTGKALCLAGGICLIAGALLALVFAFFIGITTTVVITPSYSDTASETAITGTIWNVLGPDYKTLATIFEEMEEYSSEFRASLYLPTALSTIVGAGTLASVLALSVIAALRYGAHFKNPSAKYEKYALAAILTFIAGALAFFAINGVSLDTLSSGSSYGNITVIVEPSKITKTGMILVGILAGAYFVLKVASQGKALAEKGAVPNLVFTVCSVIFSAIALSFVIKVAAKVTDWQSLTAELNFQAITVALATLNQPNALKTTPLDIDGYASSYILSIASQFLQIAVIAAIAVVIIQKISHYPSQKKTGMIEAIVLFVLTLIYFILACVCLSEANYYLNELSTDPTTYHDYLTLLAAPIALLATAILNVAVSVLNKVVLSWDKLTAKKAQPQAEAPVPAVTDEPVPAEEPAPVVTEPTEE